MPFCKNCGAEVPEGGKFCTKCGTPISVNPAPSVAKTPVPTPSEGSVNNTVPQNTVPSQNNGPAAQYTAPNQSNNTMPQYTAPNQSNNTMPQYAASNQAPAKEKKPFNIKLLIIILAASLALIVVIIGVFLFFRYQKRTLNFEKYVSVEYDGYNTEATAYAHLDNELLKNDIYKVTGRKSSYSWNDVVSSLTGTNPVYAFINSITLHVEPNENLSNGDTITVSIRYDKDAMKKAGVHFKSNTVTFKVSDLSDYIEIDPFEDVSLSYSGTSPDVSATVSCASDIDVVKYCYFSMDKYYDLKLGDTVTVSINSSDAEYALKHGYKFTCTSKEYTVENVDAYITDLDDITDDYFDQLNEEAINCLQDYYKGWTNDYLLFKGTEYIGSYFYVSKTNYIWSLNKLFLLYTVTVSSEQDDFTPYTLYIPVEFDNIKITADGECSTPSAKIWGYHTIEGEIYNYYGVKGYDSGYEAYEDISNYNDDMTLETTPNLPDFTSNTTPDSDDE